MVNWFGLNGRAFPLINGFFLILDSWGRGQLDLSLKSSERRALREEGEEKVQGGLFVERDERVEVQNHLVLEFCSGILFSHMMF